MATKTKPRTIFDTDNVPEPKESGCWQCGGTTERHLCSPTCERKWSFRQPRSRFIRSIEGNPVDLGVWATKVGKTREDADDAAMRLAEAGKIAVWRTLNDGGWNVQQIGTVKRDPQPTDRTFGTVTKDVA